MGTLRFSLASPVPSRTVTKSGSWVNTSLCKRFNAVFVVSPGAPELMMLQVGKNCLSLGVRRSVPVSSNSFAVMLSPKQTSVGMSHVQESCGCAWKMKTKAMDITMAVSNTKYLCVRMMLEWFLSRVRLLSADSKAPILMSMATVFP